MTNASGAPISALRAALESRCPRCGKGRLYDGLLKVRDRCESCDLNLAAADTGDGPIIFIVFIVGAIVVGSALWTELEFSPPMWVHVVLWPPLVLGLSLVLLRFLKSLLIALQFKHRAKEYDESE